MSFRPKRRNLGGKDHSAALGVTGAAFAVTGAPSKGDRAAFGVTSGEITGNEATSNGGGVYVYSGTLKMTGGKITGNTATSGEGGGVYVNNKFEMSGGAQIPAGDVYLTSGKYITITGALTGTSPVATITLPSTSYAENTQVLDLSAIAEADRAATCGKFALSDTTQGFVIAPDSTDSAKGVLAANSKTDVSAAITQLDNATSGNLTLIVELTSTDDLSSLVASLKNTQAENVDLVLTGNITAIDTNTFRYAKKLRSIVLPDTLTKIGDYSFSECTQLQSVVIPNSVTEIDSGVFSYCNALSEITIPSSVQLIGAKVFESCGGLNSVTIENPENKTWYYTSTYIYASNKSNGTEIDLSNPETNATYFKETY